MLIKAPQSWKKQKRSAFKVRPGNTGRKYKHVLFSQVINWTLDFPTYLVRCEERLYSEPEAELYRAGREVNGLKAPLLRVWVCWQLPCGVKHFVSLTLLQLWGKQTQQINGCTDARAEILLISFLANQNKCCAMFDFSSIQYWRWPGSAKLWFSSFSFIWTKVNSNSGVWSRCVLAW